MLMTHRMNDKLDLFETNLNKKGLEETVGQASSKSYAKNASDTREQALLEELSSDVYGYDLRNWKDEGINDAIKRVSVNELSYELSTRRLTFNGVFEFFFGNNLLDNTDFSSHYIILSYHFKDKNQDINPKLCRDKGDYSNQHSDIILLTAQEILSNKQIHPYIKTMIKALPPHS